MHVTTLPSYSGKKWLVVYFHLQLNRMQTLSDLPVDTVATFLQADEEKAKVQLFNHKVTTIKDQSRSTGHPLGEEEHNRMLEQLVKNKDVDIEVGGFV